MVLNITTYRLNKILLLVAAVAATVLGIGMRRAVLNAQEAPGWSEVPFTLESALHFRRIEKLVSGERIPAIDPDIQHPEGINTAETYTLGDEFLHATAARLVPGSGSLTSRVRWFSVLWFCLGIPLMIIWLGNISRSRWLGILGAVFYAVMLSSVIRSTGQELSRENFALPLMLAHLAASTSALCVRSERKMIMCSLLSGISLGVALISWDMIQYFVGLQWLIEGSRAMLRSRTSLSSRDKRVMIETVTTILIACLSPYHRSHGFLLSPILFMGVGLLATLAYSAHVSRSRGMGRYVNRRVFKASKACLFLVPPLAVMMLNTVYLDQYGHFGELLAAKIRFFNQKPADPSLLSYQARIMWVPALHSATSSIVFSIFPYVLLLTVPLFLIVCRRLLIDKERYSDSVNLVVFSLVTFIAFLLFVRFHVFLAIFGCGIVALGIAALADKGAFTKWIVSAFALLVLVGEAFHVVGEPEKWGRPVYYYEMRQLVDWLQDNLAGEPVLANFGPSAMILTYAGNPIVLHPKFENEDIRSRVREYGELMFRGDEEQLRSWMIDRDTRLLVYSKGEFSDVKPEWQMRYFVDALDPPDTVPAKMFEFSPDELAWFDLLWENTKYKVFRLRDMPPAQKSRMLATQALEALENGEVHVAEDKAGRALYHDPDNVEAARILRHATSLIQRGFGTER